jgi:tetratricopeptide (TPR) repeat protein
VQQALLQLAARLQALQLQAIQQPNSLQQPAQQQTLQQLALQLQALQLRMSLPAAAPQQAAVAPQTQTFAQQYAPAAAETPSLTPTDVDVRRPARTASSDCGSSGAAMGQAECLMGLDRPAEAAQRYRAVLNAGGSKDRQDAAYGLMLADLRMGLIGDAEAASAAAPQPKARAAEMRIALITQRIHVAYDAGQNAEALIDLDARARMAPEPIDLMMLRGWCYFHLERFEEARRLWEALAATGHDEAITALAVLKAKLQSGK